LTSKRSKSSGQWLRRQQKDIYTQQAKQAGFRSRAVYKLKEIQEKSHLIKPGMTVVDLGAAPGGWSQLLTKWVVDAPRRPGRDANPKAVSGKRPA